MLSDVSSVVRVAFWCVVIGIALGMVIGFSAVHGSGSGSTPPPQPAVVAPANPADRV